MEFHWHHVMALTLHKSCSDAWYANNRAVGKIFFRSGQYDYVCSGSIGANNLVWTAGHCVHDSKDGWSKNFVFVPGYCLDKGTSFTASNLYTTSQWQTKEDFSFDYAIAKFTGTPFSALPKLALVSNLTPSSSSYLSEGYPAGKPFNGSFANTCQSLGCIRDPSGSPNPVGMSCDSTGGSSGGPWIVGGRIAGLNSYGYDSQPNTMYSPFFNTATNNFFNTVVNAPEAVKIITVP